MALVRTQAIWRAEWYGRKTRGGRRWLKNQMARFQRRLARKLLDDAPRQIRYRGDDS